MAGQEQCITLHVLWNEETTVCRIFSWKLPASSCQLPATSRWKLVTGSRKLLFDIV